MENNTLQMEWFPSVGGSGWQVVRFVGIPVLAVSHSCMQQKIRWRVIVRAEYSIHSAAAAINLVYRIEEYSAISHKTQIQSNHLNNHTNMQAIEITLSNDSDRSHHHHAATSTPMRNNRGPVMALYADSAIDPILWEECTNYQQRNQWNPYHDIVEVHDEAPEDFPASRDDEDEMSILDGPRQLASNMVQRPARGIFGGFKSIVQLKFASTMAPTSEAETITARTRPIHFVEYR